MARPTGPTIEADIMDGQEAVSVWQLFGGGAREDRGTDPRADVRAAVHDGADGVIRSVRWPVPDVDQWDRLAVVVGRRQNSRTYDFVGPAVRDVLRLRICSGGRM